MQHLATYLTYRDHINEVSQFRRESRVKEAVRKAAFRDKVLTPEELSLAKKRADVLKRTIDTLDEYSQTKTEDVESVTQTALGEITAILTTAGVGLGKAFQSTKTGKRWTKGLETKLGSLKAAAPHLIPGISGLLFAITSSLPVLMGLVTIEIQTPRIARFEALKGEKFNTKDFAILTDEQIAQAKKEAQAIDVPVPKTTDKSVLSSLNIVEQVKSYMDIVAKRAVYRKDKERFETASENKITAAKNEVFTAEEYAKADETREITKRLVNKIDLEAQDYIERVFKILDVTSMCLFGFGVVGYWALEKAMSMLKITNGKFKSAFSAIASIAGVVMLNSKIAEFRNSAIRISRHKQMKDLLSDPTNFLKTPKKNIDEKNIKVDSPEELGLFGFLKQFLQDRKDYELYVKTQMVEDRKFNLAVRNLKLSPEQLNEARLNHLNLFKTVNVVDNNKKKFEEAFEIFATMLSTPMGLIAATMGSAFGWALHHIKKAPKSHMPIYSIIGTVVGLVPAIAIELYTTIQSRKAARVAYMLAQNELDDKRRFLNYSKVQTDENPLLRMSFKQKNKTFSNFK